MAVNRYLLKIVCLLFHHIRVKAGICTLYRLAPGVLSINGSATRNHRHFFRLFWRTIGLVLHELTTALRTLCEQSGASYRTCTDHFQFTKLAHRYLCIGSKIKLRRLVAEQDA